MSRKFLRGLSVWIAAGTGALLAFVLVQIHYLDYVVRVRHWHPYAGVCAYDYFQPTVFAVTGGVVTGMLLTGWFWWCYDRASPVESARGCDA